MSQIKPMIVIKGMIKNNEVKSCEYNVDTEKWEVTYNNGKVYLYSHSNVEYLEKYHFLDISRYKISKNGKVFFGIKYIYVFDGVMDRYWRIIFNEGIVREYRQSDLNIVESCLGEEIIENIFRYLKQISNLSDIKNESTGEKILSISFEKIKFLEKGLALEKYLNPTIHTAKEDVNDYIPIFPFGCNNSQYKAVINAMQNQISVIQGPPGTGKTQTILNIIANILILGKTVQVVSNNNSATLNVYEKLSSPKYGLGFLVATLGNSSNKSLFVENQEDYPEFLTCLSVELEDIREDVLEKSILLKNYFDIQEELAHLRQEQLQLNTEFEYFKIYIKENGLDIEELKSTKSKMAKYWLDMWQESQILAEEERKIGVWFKLKGFFKCGIANTSFYKQDIGKIIIIFQLNYYYEKQNEIKKRITELEKNLSSFDDNLLNNFCDDSMTVLKSYLAKKYGNVKKRKVFCEQDLFNKADEFLDEYPIILSTTFSSRNSLNQDTIYDYLIMDEASQVDIVTGALSLSCARNVVIVGDTKQLPNVVTKEVEKEADLIFKRFNIDEGYRFTNSFLQSVLYVIPNVTQVLLKEHYRCHPKIINFCNQKFYNGQLIIMTEDKGEKDVLSAVRSVPGNHARNHYSQRQVDIIKQEILPKYVKDRKETGIIAPYKNQVKALENEFEDIEVATVHKFQGREKDSIIISTVDDEISDFVDDPYLINVAVSRAKKSLMVVVTGNEQIKETNIMELISYIQYNNFEVTDSKVYSIFDYLYKQYEQQRISYLKNHKKISEHDSENLMYVLLKELLSEEIYSSLDFLWHFPLRELIKDKKLLNTEQRKYAEKCTTHLDFIIYSKISKKALLVLEVDGYNYHKGGTRQSERDILKNQILDICEIPFLRLKTNGSEEKKKIIEKLNKFIGL